MDTIYRRYQRVLFIFMKSLLIINLIAERRNSLLFNFFQHYLFAIQNFLKLYGKYKDSNYALEILNEITEEFKAESRGIKLINIDDSYQFVTKPENSEFIQKLLKKNKRQSLSQASIESLAIVAYKQPITRVDIDEIRGVKSESALQRLLERDLIKDVGRLEVPGRPILYGTTDEFLRQFGLQSLKELPSLDLYEDSDADNSLELLNSALQGIEEE